MEQVRFISDKIYAVNVKKILYVRAISNDFIEVVMVNGTRIPMAMNFNEMVKVL